MFTFILAKLHKKTGRTFYMLEFVVNPTMQQNKQTNPQPLHYKRSVKVVPKQQYID